MIRLFNPKDEENCRRIVERCFDLSIILGQKEKEYVRKVYTQEGYFQTKAIKYPLYVFEKEGLVLALGGIEGNEIKKVYVNPDNQRSGIGSAILEYLEQIAISKGNLEIVLYCFDNSIDFYKRRGYISKGQHFFEGEGIRIPTTKMIKPIL